MAIFVCIIVNLVAKRLRFMFFCRGQKIVFNRRTGFESDNILYITYTIVVETVNMHIVSMSGVYLAQ